MDSTFYIFQELLYRIWILVIHLLTRNDSLGRYLPLMVVHAVLLVVVSYLFDRSQSLYLLIAASLINTSITGGTAIAVHLRTGISLYLVLSLILSFSVTWIWLLVLLIKQTLLMSLIISGSYLLVATAIVWFILLPLVEWVKEAERSRRFNQSR